MADNLKSFNSFTIIDSLYKLILKSSIIIFFKLKSNTLEGLLDIELVLFKNIWRFVIESALYLFSLTIPPESFNEFSLVLDVNKFVEL